MSPEQIEGLQKRIKIFVAEKHWEGCEGLTITDEMKVSIAANACLMILGVEDFYFDNVKTILVFPKAFTRESGTSFGTQAVSHRAGEAWQGGPIILSWQDSLRGGRNEDDGTNVVIHEFAHALDGLDGEMGGRIIFDDAQTIEQWNQMLDREFAELVEAKQRGLDTLLDHYGATNEAEFFAVATETFFELPRELKREKPELFDLLLRYFRVDPSDWESQPRRRR